MWCFGDMNIFRLFFVSTVLIPVLVVVASLDESGIRIRKPRSIPVSEDGTPTEGLQNPVQISRKKCQKPGCASNFTEIEYQKPVKLDIKTIKNSTRSDLVEYAVANDEIETGRGLITYAILVSYAFFWTWRFIITFIIIYTIHHFWTHMHKTYGISNSMIEYYVKLGQDKKHPFHSYGGRLPTFGVSLKSKSENPGWKEIAPPGWKGPQGPEPQGWAGWEPQGWSGWVASYHDHHRHPPPRHPGHDFGWPKPEEKEGESESEEDIELADTRPLHWKIDRKRTKKYGKKAHKQGVRPSKFSYMYDENGMIILGGAESGYAWRSLLESDRKLNTTSEKS